MVYLKNRFLNYFPCPSQSASSLADRRERHTFSNLLMRGSTSNLSIDASHTHALKTAAYASHSRMTEVLDPPASGNPQKRIAEEFGIELVLATAKALYTSRKTVLPSTFEKAKSHGAIVLDRTSKHEYVRNALGHSDQMWKDMNTVFTFAIPVLEVQSIALDDTVAGTTGCCSNLMVSNYETLTSDLVRLNDLLLIARNCLATTPKAQNLAGDSLLDQQVLKLIDLCVRVTARGYDGESGGAGTKPEKLWSSIIGLCKCSWGQPEKHHTPLYTVL